MPKKTVEKRGRKLSRSRKEGGRLSALISVLRGRWQLVSPTLYLSRKGRGEKKRAER